MKCALPGMYGRKVSIQSDAIGGVYLEEAAKWENPDPGISLDDMVKTFNQLYEDYMKQCEQDTRPQSTKEVEAINDFEALKQKILKQDAEVHSQK